MHITHLSWNEVEHRLTAALTQHPGPFLRIYGVPRGGMCAMACLGQFSRCIPVTRPEDADIFVDDIIDSGRTMLQYKAQFPAIPFVAAVDKRNPEDANLGWVVFPWETTKANDAEEVVTRMLEHIGEDPSREGLVETPARIVKSWKTLFGGYDVQPESIMKTFEDGACDEMVLLKNIEFFSTCLSGSTFIDTPRGRIPISRLQSGEFVYCWDEDVCQMTLARCQNPRITGRDKRLWRVYTDKDTILCTGDHKFLTHNRGWVMAKDLKTGDSVVALNKGSIAYSGDTVRSHVVWTGMPKAIPEHRFVYENTTGIKLTKHNHVHHVNGQPNDNRPENLVVLSHGEHARLHRLDEEQTGFALFSEEQRLCMKKKQIEGIKKSQTEEVRKKRASSVKAYWDALSPEEREARNHRVLLVEKTDWREDVWCMDVPVYHNFVANGMVVHNCEHHMIPFSGKAHIAYVPNGKVIGISKLARLLEIYARRMQIQERIGQQVTDQLIRFLQPKGAACILEAQHLCMTARGVQKQNSVMVTSSLVGVFKDRPEARQELFSLIRG